MNIERQKTIRENSWLIFELILFIGIYLFCGFSDECGWWWGIPLSILLWIIANIPIAISDPFNGPYEP